MAITILNYDKITGEIIFDCEYGDNYNGFFILESVDNGINFNIKYTTNEAGILVGYFFQANAVIKLQSRSNGSFSNEFQLATSSVVLTDISSRSSIFFAQSPIHFNLQNENKDNSIQSVSVEVYIWRGFQTADLPTTPNIVFNNIKKISPADDYIAIEISEEIKAFITTSNLNKSNPQWAYNATASATTSGEGVYFHLVYRVDAESTKQLGTYYATIGYRYDFERRPYTDFTSPETFRRYANAINYDRFGFNLNTVKETSFSGVGGMITQTVPTGLNRETQTGVKCLIAYINRVGLWETFTPFGKFTESIDAKRDSYSINFRNPLNVNSQIQHQQQTGAPKGVRKFTINTSLIDERNNYQVLEMLQSPKLYLVIFENDVFVNESVGLTVDSTLVTVDNTAITVDEDNVTSENIGFYSKFVQIPIKNNTTNYLKKTKLNDKSSISYTLEFESTSNFINDL